MRLENLIKERGVVRVSSETGIDRKTLWQYQKGTQGMTLAMAEKLQKAYGDPIWHWWEVDAKKAAIKVEQQVFAESNIKSNPADVTSNATKLAGSFRGRVWPGARVYVVGKSNDANFPVHIQNKDGVDAYIKESCLDYLEPVEHEYLYDGFGTPVQGFTAVFDGEEYKVLSMDWSLEVGAGWEYTLEDKEGRSFKVDAYETAYLLTDVTYKGMLEDNVGKANSKGFQFGDMARYCGEPVIIKDIYFDQGADGYYEDSCTGYLLEDGRTANPEDLTPYCPQKLPFIPNRKVKPLPDAYELEPGEYTVWSVDPYREQSLDLVAEDGTHYLCEVWEVFTA